MLDLYKLVYSKTDVARKRDAEGNFRIATGTTGWPDYTSLLPPYGQFFAIEVKKADGVVSKEQLEVKAKILRDGGIWLEARNADTVFRFLVDHFNEHREHPMMRSRINFSLKQDTHGNRSNTPHQVRGDRRESEKSS